MKSKALFVWTALVLAGAAHAIDAPVMKEGLWKFHTSSTTAGEKPEETTYYLCRDHAYDQEGKALADKAMQACSHFTDTTSGGKRYVSMTCTVGQTVLTSKAVITSSGDTSFRTETTTTFAPPLFGKARSSDVSEQTWVSACPAGMHPGDRKDEDGTIRKRD